MIPKILIPERWRHKVFVLRLVSIQPLPLPPHGFRNSLILDWQIIDELTTMKNALDTYDPFAIRSQNLSEISKIIDFLYYDQPL